MKRLWRAPLSLFARKSIELKWSIKLIGILTVGSKTVFEKLTLNIDSLLFIQGMRWFRITCFTAAMLWIPMGSTFSAPWQPWNTSTTGLRNRSPRTKTWFDVMIPFWFQYGSIKVQENKYVFLISWFWVVWKKNEMKQSRLPSTRGVAVTCWNHEPLSSRVFKDLSQTSPTVSTSWMFQFALWTRCIWEKWNAKCNHYAFIFRYKHIRFKQCLKFHKCNH